MGVFSAVAGNQLPNQLQKRVLPALFHLRCPSQSQPTFSPWTHTSDDSYIYQLSLVLATATVSFFANKFKISPRGDSNSRNTSNSRATTLSLIHI